MKKSKYNESRILAILKEAEAGMVASEISLPDYSYGNKQSRKKGWHTSVLEKHALERYDASLSIKNASNIEVGTEDMTVMPLSGRNAFMTAQKTDLDDGNPSQKKLCRKKMSKSMSTPFNTYLLKGF